MASKALVQPSSAQPFDVVAGEYDAAFTDRLLGRWLRSMVWQRLGATFEPGQHVLELGCGTGEDAIWLAEHGVVVTATDVSSKMLDVTRAKVESAGVADRVRVARLDMETMAQPDSAVHHVDAVYESVFDGVLSNFGPVNCVEDRVLLANRLAQIVHPGGRVVLVVMGPICPWEIMWHLGHGEVRTAFRRMRSGSVASVGDRRTVQVWYPSMRRLRREFSPHFRVVESAGIGLLLPPSALGGIVERAPRPFKLIERLDRRCAGTLPWRWLGDHYLLVMERR